MEREISLYIPTGVKAQKELFHGGVIAVLLWFVCKNVVLTVVAALSGIFGSVMMCTKDQNNQSVVDQIGNMIRFYHDQQIYPYRMLDEWARKEEINDRNKAD